LAKIDEQSARMDEFLKVQKEFKVYNAVIELNHVTGICYWFPGRTRIFAA
jgi:hypothetical protein